MIQFASAAYALSIANTASPPPWDTRLLPLLSQGGGGSPVTFTRQHNRGARRTRGVGQRRHATFIADTRAFGGYIFSVAVVSATRYVRFGLTPLV